MKNKESIAMIGAGSWGTALAIVLADNGHEVRLWTQNKERIKEINETHTNQQYLPGIELPENIVASSSMESVLSGLDVVVLAVPTKAIREVLQLIKEIRIEPFTIVHVSKGIEPDTLMRISEMIREELPEKLCKDIVILSGPSHAEEVSLRHPTTVTVSSENMEAAERIQDIFMNQHFRVYTNPDIVGVEIGGALKILLLWQQVFLMVSVMEITPRRP